MGELCYTGMMSKSDPRRRENLVPAADLFREISEAADVPGSDREILEEAHKFVEQWSHFDEAAALTVRHMIAMALGKHLEGEVTED